MTTIIATRKYLAADKRSTYSHGSTTEALVVDKLIPLIPNKIYMAVAGAIEESLLIEVIRALTDNVLPLIKENNIVTIKNTLEKINTYPLFKRAQVLIYSKEFAIKVTKNGAISFIDAYENEGLPPVSEYTLMGSGSNIAIVGLRLGLPIEKIFEITGKIDASTSTDFDIVYRAEMKSFFEEQPIAE